MLLPDILTLCSGMGSRIGGGAHRGVMLPGTTPRVELSHHLTALLRSELAPDCLQFQGERKKGMKTILARHCPLLLQLTYKTGPKNTLQLF